METTETASQLTLREPRAIDAPPPTTGVKMDPLLEQNRGVAKYVAIVVRNAMEDFHVAHLTDAQMKELNPIIRNAIFTALYAMVRAGTSPAAKDFADWHMRSIPEYWEEPELLPDLKELLDREESKKPFTPKEFGFDLP